MIAFARTFEAMGFGFGVASMIIIFQAYYARRYNFLKFYGFHFALGLFHVALIELPRFFRFFTTEAVVARYTSSLSLLPVFALFYLIRALCALVGSDHFARFRTAYYSAFSAVIMIKILVILLVSEFRPAEQISWVFYNVFIVVQVIACLFIFRASKNFSKGKRRAILYFGNYFLANILVTLALNYLERFNLIDFELFNLVYFAFSFVIDAAPLVFLKWFLGQYAGKNTDRVKVDNVTDDFVREYSITEREREIINLLCQGKTNKEIGELLFISHQTVKDHVYKIFRKTGVKNRISLANLVRGV